MNPEETDAPETKPATNSETISESSPVESSPPRDAETPAPLEEKETTPPAEATSSADEAVAQTPVVDIETSPQEEASKPEASAPVATKPVVTTAVETKPEPTASVTESAGQLESTKPAEEKSETEEQPKRPRVKLNPTMPAATTPAATTTPEETAIEEAATKVTEDLKAVPTIQGLGDAPTNSAPVEVPDVANLDEAMEAELNEAMSGAAAAIAATVVTNISSDDADETDESQSTTPGELEEGARVKATVQSIAGEDIFFEIAGQRSPGMVSLRQFKDNKPPEVGKVLTVVISKIDEAEGLIHLNLPHGRAKVGGDWSAITVGQIVDCMVTKTNKGGLEVNISNLRGFLPISQVDTGFIADLEPFVGQKLTVQVMEVKPAKRNLVVSRRAFLEIGRKEEAEKLWESIERGQQFTGTVKTIKDYGAFVNIGSIDGFLHISEITWNRINHPSDVLTVGQEVEVQIVKLDKDKKRIGLGMKQLSANPWSTAEANYSKGTNVTGKVTRVADFGAFVELEQGVEGLVHISELDHQRVNRVSDVLKEGQEVDVQVLEVDMGRKRISLSLKALKEKPAVEKKAKEEVPDIPKIQRPKNAPPLKGGNSEAKSGGGLFGNPSDFNK